MTSSCVYEPGRIDQSPWLGCQCRSTTCPHRQRHHYTDIIMSLMASQITSLPIVYSPVCSGTDQRKHQSSASLAFVRGINRWPVKSPHKRPVTLKMFSFDDAIMIGREVSSWPHDIRFTLPMGPVGGKLHYMVASSRFADDVKKEKLLFAWKSPKRTFSWAIASFHLSFSRKLKPYWILSVRKYSRFAESQDFSNVDQRRVMPCKRFVSVYYNC